MATLAERIDSKLRALIGEQLRTCRRAADLQMFGFGSLLTTTNRKGETVQIATFALHLECPWRFSGPEGILFGRDDLQYPADGSLPMEPFDWDKQPSFLDVTQRAWFESRRESLPKVTKAAGDRLGGFRVELERGYVMECFPCSARRGDSSELWRFLDNRGDEPHFVVTGGGVEGDEGN